MHFKFLDLMITDSTIKDMEAEYTEQPSAKLNLVYTPQDCRYWLWVEGSFPTVPRVGTWYTNSGLYF